MKRYLVLFLLIVPIACRPALAATNIYAGGDADGYDERPGRGLRISSFQIDNANGATGITGQAAWLNGTLLTTDAVTTVYVYWGTNDGATIKANWEHWTNFGERALGTLTTNVTGLTAGTLHYYRFYGTNANGDGWVWPAASFFTHSAPAVDNAGGATDVRETSAKLNGTLTFGGAADVTIYWGQDTNNWANTNEFGELSVGSFSTNINAFSTDTMYWYVCYATNAYGEDTSAIDSFTTVNKAIFAGGVADGYDDSWTNAIAQTGAPFGTVFVIR